MQPVNQNASDEEDIVRYATVAMLTARDREKYSEGSLTRSKVICRVCGVEYCTKVSSSCPLCEIKKMISGMMSTGKLDNNRMIGNFVDIEKNIDVKIDRDKNNKANKQGYKYGDILIFGTYEGRPIEWILLKVERGKALLLSKYILDIVPYNSKYEDVTWKTCSLRKYLNNIFVWKSFSEEERSRIEPVIVKNSDYEFNKAYGESDEVDRVFCLSKDEARAYFINDMKRIAGVTSYAKLRVKHDNMKRFFNEKTGGGMWWLRSAGRNTFVGAYVEGSGRIDSLGHYVHNDNVGIRPALWLRID